MSLKAANKRRVETVFGPRFTLQRFVRLASLLRGGNAFNANTVAREFEVSPKTIQRDLDFMRCRLGYEFDWSASLKRYLLISAPVAQL